MNMCQCGHPRNEHAVDNNDYECNHLGCPCSMFVEMVCNQDIFLKGTLVVVLPPLDEGAQEVERRVKGAAQASGTRTDWHYVGGRVVVKTLDDPAGVLKFLNSYYPKWVAGLNAEQGSW